MSQETNELREVRREKTALDRLDRKILGCLAEDATRSYAAVGAEVGLSPPAVHERVKRLKRDGVIVGVAARLDGRKIGCPLLSFIHVDTSGWGVSAPILALKELSDVEEIHTVTGDTCLILKVRTRDTQALEELLEQIYSIEGVRATRSFVALNSYLERGPRPQPSESAAP